MSGSVVGAIFLGLGLVLLQLGLALGMFLVAQGVGDAGSVISFLVCMLGLCLIGAGGEMVLSSDPFTDAEAILLAERAFGANVNN